jgi:hypothetical protein
MLVGTLDICTQETETRFMFSPCTNINSKWIKNINIRPETLKQLQEIVRNTPKDIDVGNDL